MKKDWTKHYNYNCKFCNKSFNGKLGQQFCSRECTARYNSQLINARPRTTRMADCHPSRPHESRGLCISCYQRDFVNKQPARLAKRFQYARVKNLRKFGITPAQWDRMYENQNGKCPICGNIINSIAPGCGAGSKNKAACVDHDHQNGRVRGLVCSQCNNWYIGSNTLQTAKQLVAYFESNFDGRSI